MAKEMEVGCARPTGGPVGESTEEAPKDEKASVSKEVSPMIHVGKKAPDFAAPGYQKGKFISINLSAYLGKWVLLCFYPSAMCVSNIFLECFLKYPLGSDPYNKSLFF